MAGSSACMLIWFAPEPKLWGGIKGLGGMSFFLGVIMALHGYSGGGGFFLPEEILSVRYAALILRLFSRPIGVHSSCPRPKCHRCLRVMLALPFPCTLCVGRSARTRILNIDPGQLCLIK